MAAKKHAKTCAYCGQSTTDWTHDHVIPDCIWDDRPLPSGLVTVRACGTCNGYWSLHEGYFRSVLAMMANGSHPVVQEIISGAMQRHLLKDNKFRQKIIGSIRIGPSFTEMGVFAGIKPSFQFDWVKWDTVIGKIVRGMVYHDLNVPLPKGFVVQSWSGDGFMQDVNARQVIDQMSDQWSGMGVHDNVPDDVFFGKRAYSVQEPLRRLFLFVFFRSVQVFAWTAPVADSQLPDPSHPDQVALAIAERQREKQKWKAAQKRK